MSSANWRIAAIGLLGFITPPLPTDHHLSLQLAPTHHSCRCGLCTVAMNGFEAKGLDEDVFGEKSSLSGLKTFDAFRE